VVSSTPRPHFKPGKDPVSIVQEAGWAPGPVWLGGKSRPHRDSIPDRPARSQSLYRLSYPVHLYLYLLSPISQRVECCYNVDCEIFLYLQTSLVFSPESCDAAGKDLPVLLQAHIQTVHSAMSRQQELQWSTVSSVHTKPSLLLTYGNNVHKGNINPTKKKEKPSIVHETAICRRNYH
jgi:hypothetical protein